MYHASRLFKIVGSAGWLVLVLATGLRAAEKEEITLWKPAADEVYLLVAGIPVKVKQ